MFSLGFVLFGIALVLISGAAGQGANRALDGAGDGVDGGLESGSVVVGRHICGVLNFTWGLKVLRDLVCDMQNG